MRSCRVIHLVDAVLAALLIVGGVFVVLSVGLLP